MERLEQTGKTYIINDKKVKARKKTNNKWFETQDSIGYWEDFNKQKIIYQELCRSGCAFALDDKNFMITNTAYFLVINNNYINKIKYMLDFLNSPLALYQLDNICSKFDETGWRWLRQFIEQIRIPENIQDWKKEFNLSSEEDKFINLRFGKFF